MEHNSLTRVFIVIAFLSVTAILIHHPPELTDMERKRSLSNFFADISGWRAISDVPLDSAVINALHLDDYVNRTFTDGDKSVTLYIGYYYASRKIGAAHDPLVCFTGQGWLVTDDHEANFNSDDMNHGTIAYTEMTVQRSQERQFLVYWFQAYDRTASNTLSQKIFSTWQRLVNRRGDNALIRISIDAAELSEEECRQIIHKFIHAMYPKLMLYIKG